MSKTPSKETLLIPISFDDALLRVGAAYEFHVGNGTIAPVIAYDFVEDTKDVLYADVAIGFAF